MFRKQDPRVKILSTIDVLAGASPRELQQMCGLTTEVRLPAGRVLCAQGDIAHEVLLLVDGQVAVSRDGIAVGVIKGGGIVGEMAVLEQTQRTATTTALTDITVLALSSCEFQRLVEGFPTVAANVRSLVEARTEEILALAA